MQYPVEANVSPGMTGAMTSCPGLSQQYGELSLRIRVQRRVLTPEPYIDAEDRGGQMHLIGRTL